MILRVLLPLGLAIAKRDEQHIRRKKATSNTLITLLKALLSVRLWQVCMRISNGSDNLRNISSQEYIHATGNQECGLCRDIE